jgi:hypothetical protein
LRTRPGVWSDVPASGIAAGVGCWHPCLIAVLGSGTALSTAGEPKTAIMQQDPGVHHEGAGSFGHSPVPKASPRALCVVNCSEPCSAGQGGRRDQAHAGSSAVRHQGVEPMATRITTRRDILSAVRL